MLSISLLTICVLAPAGLSYAHVEPQSQAGVIRLPLTRKSQEISILETARLHQRQRLSSIKKREQYKAPLYNDQGSQYLISVGVGTPPQNFSVTLDTGSADLWIPSSTCDKQSCPFGGFDTEKSSTFQTSEEKFSIQYGIGSVNGTYARDTVTVAGAKVSQQQFGLATHTKDILIPQDDNNNAGGQGSSNTSNMVNANGILGLGYPQLTAATTQNNPAYTPFIFNLVAQGLITEPVFSIYLNSASKQGYAGEILLGGVDASKYEGSLVYLPVAKLQSQPNPAPKGEGNDGDDNGGNPFGDDGSGNEFLSVNSSGRRLSRFECINNLQLDISNHANTNHRFPNDNNKITSSNSTLPNYDGYYYWMVYGQGIAVRNGVENPEFKFQKPGAFILDTGTTLTYLPNDIAISIVTAIAGTSGFQLDRQSGLLVVECAAARSPATLELQMSTSSSMRSTPVTFAVKASELVIPLDADTPARAKTCLFGIAPVGGSGGGLGPNMFLIGDSMLRSAYLVFDMGQNRVGIAAAKGMGGKVNGSNSSMSTGNDGIPNSASSGYHSSAFVVWQWRICAIYFIVVCSSYFMSVS